jgi:Carbon-nitrogen hydrolase
MADGSRVHAVLGTLASRGTCISLRVPANRSFSLEDCVASGSLTPGTAQLLSRMIEAKLAFLISGGTGSGNPTRGLPHTISRPRQETYGQILGKHRKMVPTGPERLIWAQGDGSTLSVFDTPFGKISGLTCFENYMPLVRLSMSGSTSESGR